MKLQHTVKSIIVFGALSVLLFAFKNKPQQVVCFGDSITYGALVERHSWVYYLNQEHPETEFINAGRSGRKTSDQEELLPVLKKYPTADEYLILLGVNDLKDGTDSMVNTCVENMRWMLGKIKEVNPEAKIVILAPVDINLKTMNDINQKKKYNLNTKKSLYKLTMSYRKLAKEENVGFYSLLHAVSAPNFVDGLHPNEEGHKEMAKAVWKGVF